MTFLTRLATEAPLDQWVAAHLCGLSPVGATLQALASLDDLW